MSRDFEQFKTLFLGKQDLWLEKLLRQQFSNLCCIKKMFVYWP